jgi:hypothetical protein
MGEAWGSLQSASSSWQAVYLLRLIIGLGCLPGLMLLVGVWLSTVLHLLMVSGCDWTPTGPCLPPPIPAVCTGCRPT